MSTQQREDEIHITEQQPIEAADTEKPQSEPDGADAQAINPEENVEATPNNVFSQAVGSEQDTGMGSPEQEQMTALKDENQALKDRLILSYVRMASIEKGVSKEKLPYMMRLAALDGIDLNEPDKAASAVEAAVDRVLRDLPELCGHTFGGTGSLGNRPRATGHGADSEEGVMQTFLRGMRK